MQHQQGLTLRYASVTKEKKICNIEHGDERDGDGNDRNIITIQLRDHSEQDRIRRHVESRRTFGCNKLAGKATQTDLSHN